MNQKSISIVLVALATLSLLVFISKSSDTSTYIQTPTLDSAVEEIEVIDQEEPEATSGTETPTQMPQGKINVQVACESALVYTTFVNSAAADAFIEECVAGEHPEVIERYLKDLNVDGALI